MLKPCPHSGRYIVSMSMKQQQKADAEDLQFDANSGLSVRVVPDVNVLPNIQSDRNIQDITVSSTLLAPTI